MELTKNNKFIKIFKNTVYLLVIIHVVCAIVAWILGFSLHKYKFFEIVSSLWESPSSVFFSKIGAIFFAIFEAFWVAFIGPSVLILSGFNASPLLYDIILTIFSVLWIAIFQIDDKIDPKSKLNLELLGLRPVFRTRMFNLKKDFCFYLGPFSEPFNSIYIEHVVNTIRKIGMRICRADEIFGTRPVMDDIWDSINEASIIIADVTGRSPNVMYEIGMAHTIGKKVIIISQTAEDIPFDLQHFRGIIYNNSESGLLSLREKLIITIQSELKFNGTA